MNKVYVIYYEQLYSNGEKSMGVCYVYSTLRKAKNMLRTIKKDEIQFYIDDGYSEDFIEQHTRELSLGFKINLHDEWVRFGIVEMEVK